MGRTGGRVWWISGLVVVWVLAGVVWAAVAFTGADDTEVPVDEVTSQVPIQESDDRFVNEPLSSWVGCVGVQGVWAG